MDQNELQKHIQNNTLEQATAELEHERDNALAGGDKQAAALASNDLGVVYSYQRRSDDAREAFRQAQVWFIESADTAGQGRATGNMAELEERAGNSEEAGALYMQAADLLHEGQAFGDEFTTRRRLSKFYLTRGATLQALSETSKALKVKPNASAWDRFQRFVYQLPLQMMGLGSE
jgi:tetratricopeptide (TPR) repeat protein